MIKLSSWNVNGLRACWNKGGLQKFIGSVQPDILCLQETKALPEQIELEGLDEYQLVWNSALRKGYSGTLILSKRDFLSSSLNFSDDIAQNFKLEDQFGNTNNEGRLITLEFADFYLVTVYTPNSKGDLSRLDLRFKSWDPGFLEHCKKLGELKPVLMSGDFNVAHQEIDLARPKENVGKHGFTNEERQGFDNFLAAGFLDTFRHLNPDKEGAYSWWTHWNNARAKNVGWRIDYWLASKALASKISKATIHPEFTGSDHCPVSLEIDI